MQILKKGVEFNYPGLQLFDQLAFSADQPHFQYSNLRLWFVQRWACSRRGRDGVDDVHAADHFAEDCIMLIEVRRSADLLIYGSLVGRYLISFEPESFHGVESGVRETFSLYDIELASAAGAGGVNIVAQSCGSQCTAVMEQ